MLSVFPGHLESPRAASPRHSRRRPRLLDTLPVTRSGVLQSVRRPWSSSAYTYELVGPRLRVLRGELKAAREIELPAAAVTLRGACTLAVAPGDGSKPLVLRAPTEELARAWLADLRAAQRVVARRDFALRGQLGAGHFGSVFLAGLGDETLAAKHVPVGKASDVVRLQRERALLEAAPRGCPFLLSLRYAFRERGAGWLVTEFCGGGDLRSLLDAQKTLAPEAVRLLGAELLLAVEALHGAGMAHRDIKPENVFLTAEGHVRLGDFGLARRFRSAYERSDSFCGTHGYMAPEMLQRHPSHGQAVDLWALGCVLYEMAHGRSPFAARSAHREAAIMRAMAGEYKRVDAGSPLADLVDGLLRPNPLDRLSLAAVKAHPFFSGVSWDSLAAEQSPVAGLLSPPEVVTTASVGGASSAFDQWAEDLAGFDYCAPSAPAAAVVDAPVALVRQSSKGEASSTVTLVMSSAP